ncbi:right-handed parallel beta-helix repeat-containing protein [Pseudoponticoccus marisrubri]|uniref:Serine protease n=1 Tax=Pseudoponticoccus marisrubri TaxID=1685382 RepID=A0A0W7WMC7_9RHOB|nr:right-handed parallel beta-helix repeat-containing protein [Pseudoponticoccus marisrubri]KUF11718.1 hypothetical protein AVJ23_03795 [Pseudoponticoccus marisrubri]
MSIRLRPVLSAFAALALVAGSALAQPAEFPASDFGKIVVSPRQSTSGFQFEQAIGSYQNEPIANYGENSPLRQLGRPIGRLDLLLENGKTGFCTAFIVDEKHLLTNHHCIPGNSGVRVQAAQFVAGYVTPGRETGAERYSVNLNPVESDEALDYAVVQVFGDPSARYGRMELDGSDLGAAELLWIIGHPMGQSQHISREGCAASDPAVSDEGKLVHTCDTLSGNSGSPVIRVTDQRVVALHHAGDSRLGVNFAIPMARILKRSRVLQAAATPPEPEERTPAPVADACRVLWTEAKEMGCDGFSVFLESCGGHALAPLAQRLSDRQCAAPEPETPVDRAKGGETLPERPEPTGGNVIRVAQDNSGDVIDLVSAVREVPEGGYILIEPGTYDVGVRGLGISKPLTLRALDPATTEIRGAGSAVLRWQAEGGRIEGLTIRQTGEKGVAVYQDAGQLTIWQSRLVSGTEAAVFARYEAELFLESNVFEGGDQGLLVTGEDARVEMRGNSFRDHDRAIALSDYATAVIRDNEVSKATTTGLEVWQGATLTLEDSRFEDIKIALLLSDRGRGTVTQTEFTDGAHAIIAQDGGSVTVRNSEMVRPSVSAIRVESGGHVDLSKSILRHGRIGVWVREAGTGAFEGNDLRFNDSAFRIEDGAGKFTRRDNME